MQEPLTAHSEPKGQPAKDKIPAYRSNVRLRRKVTRKGVHNPCASDDMIANQPDAQCQKNGQHPTRFPPFEKVAEIAEKAKPGPLQDPPEHRTGDPGKRRFTSHRRVNSISGDDNP
jgi:hypothetical protein